jgi:Flp pilus assembly protein TadG
MHHRVRKIRNVRRSSRLNWLLRFRRDERGVQLAELSIVIPIMLMMFAAVAEFGLYFHEYSTTAKAARLGARFICSKSLDGRENWEAQTKNLVVYGNTAGTGSPVLYGLSTSNVDIQYAGGTYKNGTGVPDRVTITIINYKHQPIFDLGKLTKSSFSLAVDVKPSVTMHFLLNANSV